MKKSFKDCGEEIIALLKNNPEELVHALDTAYWLFRINGNPDDSLGIAALGHDVERAINSWDYNKDIHDKKFRKEHSKRSAEIIIPILERNKIDSKDIKLVENCILNHEWGGSKESDIIRDADSLANFQWCDEMFGKKDFSMLKEVMAKMYGRMSKDNRKFIDEIHFKNKEIRKLLP